MEPIDQLARLEAKLVKDRRRQKFYSDYFEGKQPLRFVAPVMEAELEGRIDPLVVNWPRLGTNAYANRLEVTEFHLSDEPSVEADMAAMWSENDGELLSKHAILDALIGGRSYAVVGSPDDDDDPPILSIEHASQMITAEDPRTRKTTSALRRWHDEDKVQWATLLLPDSTITFRRDAGTWKQDDVDDHELGEVPVAPLIHGYRPGEQPLGTSLFHDVIPIVDAANKMATDMMVSGEFHAMPRRWVLGMTEDDFVDENGRQKSSWSAVAGRLWASDKGPKDVAVGQFPESDLANFHATIKLLALIVSQILALPQDYMSFTTDNPTSADAMRASETRLIKNCENLQVVFGAALKRVQRLLLRFERGTEFDRKWKSIEVVWKDPATPTRAQAADATTKLVQVGVLPIEQAREDLGYTDEQRKQMAEMDKTAADLKARALAAAPAPVIDGTPPPVEGAPVAA